MKGEPRIALGLAVFLAALLVAPSLRSQDPDPCSIWDDRGPRFGTDTAAGDLLGSALDASGGRLIVGAPGEADPGRATGAAYVHERNFGGADSWTARVKLQAPDREQDDEFGAAVAIDGTVAVVGAPREDTSGGSAGSVYVFEKDLGGLDRWGFLGKLQPADIAALDSFGTAVALSGTTLVVGSPGADAVAPRSGAVYVFERSASGWSESAKLVGSDTARFDSFGDAVAIDGDVIVVGARFADIGGVNAGASYVFSRNAGGSGNWGEVAKLSNTTRGRFGHSVDVRGSVIVVGAPFAWLPASPNQNGAVSLFEQGSGGGWSLTRVLLASDAAFNIEFGQSVALANEDQVLVGAFPVFSSAPFLGAAYLYSRDVGGAGNWGELLRYQPVDLLRADQMGVAVAATDTALAVGAFTDDTLGTGGGAFRLLTAGCLGPPPPVPAARPLGLTLLAVLVAITGLRLMGAGPRP